MHCGGNHVRSTADHSCKAKGNRGSTSLISSYGNLLWKIELPYILTCLIGVQDHKRHRSEVFVYQRQNGEAAFANIPTPTPKPVIHISQPAGQDAAFQGTKRKHTLDGETKEAPPDELPTTDPAVDANAVGGVEPRRFHLSRPDAMLSTSSYPTRNNGGSRKRSAPALFVERRIKRISSRTVGKLQSAANVECPTSTTGQDAPTTQNTLPATGGVDVDKPESRKYKKPGVAKLASKGIIPKTKTELPQSMTNRLDVDMDRMAEEMNAFVLEQIGLNIQKSEEEQQQNTKSSNGGAAPSHLKFKPKAPAKRYSERHPEKAPELAAKGMADVDVSVSDTDDDDYIIETYVRVPASKMGENVSPQHVGLLVFDEEPDIEYFYGEGSDSEDEWAEDEEDENGN